MAKSLTLSRKHGLNPSLMLCFYCQQPSGIALLGKMRGTMDDRDPQAPRQATYDMEPCNDCKALMAKGVILISVKDDDRDYRTGGWCVVKDDVIDRLFDTASAASTKQRRCALVADSAWDQLGLPRGDINMENKS